jgi:hypothetical protein
VVTSEDENLVSFRSGDGDMLRSSWRDISLYINLLPVALIFVGVKSHFPDFL